MENTSTLEAQQALTQACVDSLFVYRKFCASVVSLEFFALIAIFSLLRIANSFYLNLSNFFRSLLWESTRMLCFLVHLGILLLSKYSL